MQDHTLAIIEGIYNNYDLSLVQSLSTYVKLKLVSGPMNIPPSIMEHPLKSSMSSALRCVFIGNPSHTANKSGVMSWLVEAQDIYYFS